jgi:hypothetical protein
LYEVEHCQNILCKKAASDKVYQFHAHGRWFSAGTPNSSTTKTGRHDIAEILLKMALNTIKSNQVKSWLGTYASISGGVIFDLCANTYPLSEMMCIRFEVMWITRFVTYLSIAFHIYLLIIIHF